MDCLPPPTGSRSDLHFCRARAVFRAALILCASFLLSSDALALDAVWIGTNGCFQVWTRNECKMESVKCKIEDVEPSWIDVEAEGVTPQTGVEYTFRVVFNYAAGTYSVYVKTGLTEFARLREDNPVNPVNPVQNFPLAASGSALSSIGFDGDGWLRSIFGNYVSGFSLRLR